MQLGDLFGFGTPVQEPRLFCGFLQHTRSPGISPDSIFRIPAFEQFADAGSQENAGLVLSRLVLRTGEALCSAPSADAANCLLRMWRGELRLIEITYLIGRVPWRRSPPYRDTG